MEFVNELKKLSDQVAQRKQYISNEEATKQSLIIPFLNVLGYDVFNPYEVEPEYGADFGSKKGEKVDYAIKKDGIPIIFIEAKSIHEKLDNHNGQLYRYFNSNPNVKFSILTNGDYFHFYTDLDQDNIMDKTPFFSFRLSTISNVEIETLQRFTKDNFENERLVEYAQELVYMTNINITLKELFKNPSDEFLRFLIKDFTNTRITNNVLERFRPIIKKAINQTMLGIISDGLFKEEKEPEIFQQEIATKEAAVTKENLVLEDTEDELEEDNVNPNIITTVEELRSFDIVREILLKADRDVSDIRYKDTVRYFGILNKVSTRWFIRINYDAKIPHFNLRIDIETCKSILPTCNPDVPSKKEGLSRIYFEKPEDLYHYEALIVASFDSVL
ncbi:hypothetical protein QFZ31_005752 [Neobacillus niacini]|uniref:type I restriction endonuclease n=1 Tax=Neobacillus driksii TaxID=3035913 RepID=UPI002783D0FF|nr:type I restriction endonuclease [Neobacillus niacini]MDQ0975874.1 hypothetical protein [Neobacillus niacini]